MFQVLNLMSLLCCLDHDKEPDQVQKNVFPMEYVGMFMIYSYINFHKSSLNGLLVNIFTPRVKYRFCVATILVYTLQKTTLMKLNAFQRSISIQNLTTLHYVVPVPLRPLRFAGCHVGIINGIKLKKNTKVE
jgi:hypothetical protein